MVRTRKSQGQQQRRRKTRTRSNRRRRNQPRRVAQPSIGRLVAKGVKSLVSKVPVIGGVLDTLADFGFKAMGLTSSPLNASSGTIRDVPTKTTSLHARMWISLSTIVAGSRSCIQIDMGRKVMTQYHDGRLQTVTIKVSPTNPLAKRGGDWSLAIQPFFNDSDVEAPGMKDSWFPTEQGLHHMYLSTTGPASKPLQLTYKPRVTDGRAFTFLALDQPVLEVVVRYEQNVRAAYDMFSAEEFACETLISGQVELRVSPAMPPTNTGGYLFSSTVTDKFKDVAMFLTSTSTHTSIVVADDVDFTCKDEDQLCKVSGSIKGRRSFSSFLRIEDLEIDDDDMHS